MNLITGYYPNGGDIFTRNPYIIEVSAPTLATYIVQIGGTTVFTGNGIGVFSINLADILDAAFSETVTPAGNGLFLEYAQGSNCLDFTFTISTEDGATDTLQGKAWKGGINKKDFRALKARGTDVFADKLRYYSGNFFFTTRTYGWDIHIRETELEPLAFIMPTIAGEEQGYITVREALTKRTVTVSGNTVFGALDIDAVRKHFFNTYNILANVFEVMMPGNAYKVACRITIEKAPESVERCAVRFLNSFGVYERIDMIGETTVMTGEVQNDNVIYQSYDADTDSFVKERLRTPVGNIYKVKTGVKRSDELLFIQDMIASDKVFLTLPDGEEIKVIPSISQNSRAYTQVTPESMEISFQAVEEESNFTPMRTEKGSERKRIFTSVFTEQFN